MSENPEEFPEFQLQVEEIEAPAPAETSEAAPRQANPLLWAGIGFGSIVLLGVLAALAWFVVIPALGPRYTTLDSSKPSLFHPDGLSVEIAGGPSAQVNLDTVPREPFMAGQAGAEWEGARSAIPAGMTPLSPIYLIRSKEGSSLNGTMAVPNGAEPIQSLDLYRWDAEAGRWLFVPSSYDEDNQVIRFYVPDYDTRVMAMLHGPVTSRVAVTVSPGGEDFGPQFGTAFVEGVSLSSGGQLEGSPATSAAPSTLLLISNRASAGANYADPVIAGQIAAQAGAYAGVALDLGYGSGYEALIGALRTSLPNARIELIVQPADISAGLVTNELPADMVWLDGGINPWNYVEDGPVEGALNALVDQRPREQVGLLVGGYHADVRAGAPQPISFEQAMSVFGQPAPVEGYVDAENRIATGSPLPLRLSGSVQAMGFDQALAANYILYGGAEDGGMIYLIGPQAINQRLNWARAFTLGGIGLRGAGAPSAPRGAVDGVTAFAQGLAVSQPEALGITWRVTGSSGAALVENSGDLNAIQFLWQAASQPDTVQISAEVGEGGNRVPAGSVEIAVAEATASPTGAPTPTATLITAVNATSQPTPAGTPGPRPTTAPAAPTPITVSGSIVAGAFEYGGQTHTLSYPGDMRRAGMTWVRYQHKWGPGDDPVNALSARIAAARSNNLKVLFSIVGPTFPDSINYQAYVNFVAGAAALGPDAIQIWNEQNLSREWPYAEISGANYVNNMLAPSYNAIKAANPNVMVISGAPAPTGYWGATGCGCDDPNVACGCSDYGFIQQMKAAGAANYVDCIGVHYNEGIIPPSQTSGDPRADNYYTRYFFGMLNTYYSTFGKPVCFTELGYLSPDGYGGLPSNFSWAGNTSVDEQAAWLAEAAVLASQSGKVRLMIVWNVDIFVWETYDPQGGYAIVRPGGSCPACDALAAVAP